MTVKPFKTYEELVGLMLSRGMHVPDSENATRKLAQVGYYRLSGFWYPCRTIELSPSGRPVISPSTKKVQRTNTFAPGTSFDDIFTLYLFDKKLRLLMLDAIERIETHIRSVIAHEVGYHDPLAYQKKSFINPKQCETFIDKRTRKARNIWDGWVARQQDQVDRCREDCIEWHRINQKPMPFWVVVEAWDFGTVSKYFEMLQGKYQTRVAKRLGISKPGVLVTWLKEINTLRNRCAHHTRIWNQYSNNPLPVLDNEWFARLDLDRHALSRLYGLIVVIWYLVRIIGPHSQWLQEVAKVIDTKPSLPGCTWQAMGLPDNGGFPIRQVMKIDTEIRHVTKPGTNLFLELGFPTEEAERLHLASKKQINDTKQLKEQLMSELAAWIEQHQLKQAEAADILMVSRPRVSDVVNKKTAKFTIDTLVEMLSRIGKPVRLAVGQTIEA